MAKIARCYCRIFVTVVCKWTTGLYISSEQAKPILGAYHPWMRHGRPGVFSHICLSVCLSVIALTFERKLNFGICRYIFKISRSSWYIKVIGSRLQEQKCLSVSVLSPWWVVCLRLKGNLVKEIFHSTSIKTRSSAIRRESAHLTWLYCTVQMAFQYETV